MLDINPFPVKLILSFVHFYQFNIYSFLFFGFTNLNFPIDFVLVELIFFVENNRNSLLLSVIFLSISVFKSFLFTSVSLFLHLSWDKDFSLFDVNSIFLFIELEFILHVWKCSLLLLKNLFYIGGMINFYRYILKPLLV